MTLEEFAHTEVVCESAAPPDVGEFIDALRAYGYRVVKLEWQKGHDGDIGMELVVTEELT